MRLFPYLQLSEVFHGNRWSFENQRTLPDPSRPFKRDDGLVEDLSRRRHGAFFESAQRPNRGKYIRVRPDAIYGNLAMDGVGGGDGEISQLPRSAAEKFRCVCRESVDDAGRQL